MIQSLAIHRIIFYPLTHLSICRTCFQSMKYQGYKVGSILLRLIIVLSKKKKTPHFTWLCSLIIFQVFVATCHPFTILRKNLRFYIYFLCPVLKKLFF